MDVTAILWYTISVKVGRYRTMRVLGIDPGYAIVGWGVVEYISNRFAPIGYGAVITEKDTPFEQRLVEIYESVFDICKRYQPEALSIEKLYYQHNQTTV
ncbi:MAG TPA: crossover junction endodeoxyribonuclease RuvC, partial [Subdoligranulum sp.]|nr:crossover junction endodeoxyribonuclease RuvC [Subdoligranulum sp.]